MEIYFSEIPSEGLAISGKLSRSFFGLREDDSIRVAGDIHYDLTLYAFRDAVVMEGSVSGPFELQCGTCLEFFRYDLDIPDWESEMEIEEGQSSFDPRESLRDEILLALPAAPHCADWTGKECPRAELLARFEHDGIPLEDNPADARAGNDPWSALDQLPGFGSKNDTKERNFPR